MRIVDVLFAPGLGGFFNDDQEAILRGAGHDGFLYVGAPVTPGFPSIRTPAETLGIGLVLEDGSIAWGDMLSVQYSGAAGRDPLFRSAAIQSFCEAHIVPRLKGLEISSFRPACTAVMGPVEGKRLPIAVEYGLSQALLNAAAAQARRTAVEVICDEFDLPLIAKRVPLYGQSGDSREINLDKMLLKRVDVLPHGLTNSPEKFGPKGEAFKAYVRQVSERSRQLSDETWKPKFHFDVYGLIGREFGLIPEAIADYIATLSDDSKGFEMSLECPADFGSLEAQVEGYAEIIRLLEAKGSNIRIAVDERCNTLSDVEAFTSARACHMIQIKTPDVGSVEDTVKAAILCKEAGIGAYIGGSCTETDVAARVAANIAIATQAEMVLAKPGMGVDEGVSIVGNEQSRVLAMLARKAA